MDRVTFSAPEDQIKQVNQRLSYGDSRSQWYRDAAALRLAVDPLLDGHVDDVSERREFVVTAVEEKLEREEQS